MKKRDLRFPMWVRTRDGGVWSIVVGGKGLMVHVDGRYAELRDYNNDLTYPGNPNNDIMKVYGQVAMDTHITSEDIARLSTCITVPVFWDISEDTGLVWKREDVKEVTMKEVEEKFGCKVKIKK